jgi:1,5-anhydro-D-fructose reductase (1,5-anhydro-D-mannitol-forming)
MTQRPAGEVLLRSERGTETLPVEHENLYARALTRFHAAIRGDGEPAATGEDGVRSLALALAVHTAAREGRRVTMDEILGES